jgi:hypothetical protein
MKLKDPMEVYRTQENRFWISGALPPWIGQFWRFFHAAIMVIFRWVALFPAFRADFQVRLKSEAKKHVTSLPH